MRIDPSSQAGGLMVEMGVPEEDLGATQFIRFNWQAGGAITLPVPFGGCVVFAKSQFLPEGDLGELSVGRHMALLRHEMVHVRQRKEWGFLGYWARHIWARIQTRSMLAKESAAEKPGYEAQDAAYRFLDERGVT